MKLSKSKPSGISSPRPVRAYGRLRIRNVCGDAGRGVPVPCVVRRAPPDRFTGRHFCSSVRDVAAATEVKGTPVAGAAKSG